MPVKKLAGYFYFTNITGLTGFFNHYLCNTPYKTPVPISR
uniref:Uncharacterized protein n=1 Tax=uncultured Desulfobacterium sp. TaxID=201089 RepID=E1YI76_9BACT|nr:unknown protein [uncultured Desulfobacterium sp.]